MPPHTLVVCLEGFLYWHIHSLLCCDKLAYKFICYPPFFGDSSILPSCVIVLFAKYTWPKCWVDILVITLSSPLYQGCISMISHSPIICTILTQIDGVFMWKVETLAPLFKQNLHYSRGGPSLLHCRDLETPTRHTNASHLMSKPSCTSANFVKLDLANKTPELGKDNRADRIP